MLNGNDDALYGEQEIYQYLSDQQQCFHVVYEKRHYDLDYRIDLLKSYLDKSQSLLSQEKFELEI